MKLKEIDWEEIRGALRRKSPTVIAAVCTAEAGGSDPQYAAGQRRELLVMVLDTGRQAEAAIQGWLKANGWTNATILEHRRLEETFDSGDNRVRACYVNAMSSGGACLVYDVTA
ncbi:MAG: hypothetical protein JSS95_09250 [Acidobacteria bacterium]|nr:hypothetical protein [Acidobacteriota bacterium]